MFNFFPYWTPALVTAAVTGLFFVFVGYLGLLYGALYWSLLYVMSSWSLAQWQVADHRGRVDVGRFAGIAASLAVSFYVFVLDFASLFTKVLALACATGFLYVAFAVHAKKPQAARTEVRSALASQVILSAPSEATDEEADLLAATSSAASGGSSKGKGKSVFVKDPATGQLRRVSADEYSQMMQRMELPGGANRGPVRKRTLGPRLCGTCLTDRRAIVSVPAATSGGGSTRSSNGGSKKGGPSAPIESTAISIATHCNCCGMCVVDQDHHCMYLG